MRQSHNGDIQRFYGTFLFQPRRERVLVLDIHFQIRHYAYHRQAGLFFQHRQTRAQDLHIPAEFIDDKSFDPCPLIGFQQFHRTVQLRKHAAPVDIPCQQHRGVHQLCQPHIDDVVGLQVNLGRAARALDDNDIEFLGQTVVGTQNIGDQRLFMAEIFLCGHIAAHLAVDDDLTTNVTAGFEQNRVHPHIRLHARSLGLHDLGAAHFQPVAGHKAVQRHVLAFERCRLVAILGKNAAECGAEQAFPCTAHRALHHDTFCFTHASTSPMICNSF